LAPFFLPFFPIHRENCYDITPKITCKIKFCRYFCDYIAALLDWLGANRNSHFPSVASAYAKALRRAPPSSSIPIIGSIFFARMGKKNIKPQGFASYFAACRKMLHGTQCRFIRRQACFIPPGETVTIFSWHAVPLHTPSGVLHTPW
jgi:hypothetical protein